ncbi:MFS transporter [Effusibacillus lacus]|uniref:MFS transporter n=1 Tax=Effusibacillus lacus TaxID=1348429 RepID=A0A292YIS0_9BACL|nr:MFS transporter [Effusibacillus lacus]
MNALYIHTVLGKSVTTAGIVLMLMNAAGMVGNLVGGALYDRWGGKPLILAALLGSAAAVTTLGFTKSFAFYVAFIILLGFMQNMAWPSFHALIGKLWPAGGRRAFNMFYVVNNLGVAIGTALGGFLAEISFLLVFVLNGLTYLLYATIFLYAMRRQTIRYTTDDNGNPFLEKGADSTSEGRPADPIHVPVAFLALGILIAWTAYSQWAGPLAVYTQQAGYSLSAYSFLWTLNGILIVAGQPLLTPLLNRYMSKLSVQLITGSVLYVVSFALIAQYPNYTGFLIGMTIMTIGEMILLPGVPAAINQLAPKERTGFYQGIAAGAGSAGRMLGPVLGGMVYDHSGAIVLFACGVAACLVATVSFLGFHISTNRRFLN